MLRYRQVVLEDLCRGKGQGQGDLWLAVAQARQGGPPPSYHKGNESLVHRQLYESYGQRFAGFPRPHPALAPGRCELYSSSTVRPLLGDCTRAIHKLSAAYSLKTFLGTLVVQSLVGSPSIQFLLDQNDGQLLSRPSPPLPCFPIAPPLNEGTQPAFS